MHASIPLRLLVLAALLLPVACASPGAAEDSVDRPLAHAVFVSLVDASPATVAALAADCRRELGAIPGVNVLVVGPREADLVREINDTGFDLGLVIVFRDRAAHDAYQTDPRHVALVEAHKANWKQVRVFDWSGAAAQAAP